MKPYPTRAILRPLRGLALIGIASLSLICQAAPDKQPDGLAPSDWQSIRAAYEAGRHAIQPIAGRDGQWQARNPGQQWLTTFDQRGFEAIPQGGDWTWGLELRSYGFGDKQWTISGRPEVQTAGQRLSYQWDATVQEWFVNDQRGLEHGFTIGRRPERSMPSDQSNLTFTLTTRGCLRPKVTADAQGVTFQDAAGTAVLNYTGLKVWDADGKALPARFEPAGSNGFRLCVDETTAHYPITIDPIAQQAYLKASNSGATDNFGTAVAVSGDTAVIGAPDEASNATAVNGDGSNNLASSSGAAYVFIRSGGTWTQQAYLKASNSGAFDGFGVSVAVSGDTVVIGAELEDSNANTVDGVGTNNSAASSGAAYVFTRSGTNWTQQAYLKASNCEANDRFGWSVALSGDTAVIGAYQEDSNAKGVGGNGSDNSASSSGAAYVFTRSGTTWMQQAYLKASNSGAFDKFGSSVAVSGDTAVIGAWEESSNANTVGGDGANNGAIDSGAAYVFTRSGTTWTQQAYLKASNSGANDQFGWSVALSGDTAVIGAPGESSNATTVGGGGADNSAPYSGAAYVFTRSDATWTQQAYLKASNSGANDYFGYAVAVSGDIAVIGGHGEDSTVNTVNGDGSDDSASLSGAAYAFTRSGSIWSHRAYLKASNCEANDRFGQAVAVSGDTAVIGAWAESSSATTVGGDGTNNLAFHSGAAYTFSGLGPAAPLIAISGNTQPIAPGSNVPSTADDTDYGNVALLNTQVTHTFTISNSGEAALTLTGTPKVALSGPAAMDFKVTSQPDAAVAVGGTTTFDITFDPSQPGLRMATVTVASDDGVNGSYSFAISGFGGLAKLLTQTISFAPPTTVYMGQGPLTLVATSSSGLPVTLSLMSGPASLTGNALTLNAPGTVKVLATQAGAGNFLPARSVLRTLAVQADPSTLTLINLTQIYDGQPKAPSTIPAGATLTYKQGTTVVAAPTNAGAYTVTAVLGGVTKIGTLVIAKAPLYVTPDDQRKFAGQANPTPLGFTYSGFQGTDTASVITKAPALKTTATTASAGGLYPITASGATALNYSFIYRQGTLVVESFAGTYEALLVDGTALPAGKVSIVVTNTSKTFTGKIYTATESTALPVSGTLTTNGDETATGAFSGTRLTIPYTLSFTLPLYGDVTVTTTRNGQDIGSATNGHKLLALPRGKTVLYGGAHTAVLEPVMPTASDVPIGAGWAKATISATGVMTLSGRLGDGTAFTQTLTPDVDSNPGYRLFVQPYKTGKVTRTQSYLGGAFTLMPHPSLTNRRYIGAANLSWQKTGLSTDTAYRAGFGPVTTVLILDPWLAPKGIDTLAVRLGLSAAGFSVAHSATDSAANANLPTQVGLSVKNVVNVLAPVTIPVNSTKWYTKLSTTTGTFTGGFELQDGLQKRKVTFSGVLRQPAAALETVIGDGHYVQPALTGAPTTEQHTGEVLFTRP